MSVRYEWGSAAHPFFAIEVVPEGTRHGEFSVTAEAGIVIATDDVYVLEGSIDDLQSAMIRVLSELDALKAREGRG